MKTTKTAIRKDLNRALRALEEAERKLLVFHEDPLDLVGIREAAELLEITVNALATRRSRGRFPEPVLTLSGTPIWHREDIEALRS